MIDQFFAEYQAQQSADLALWRQRFDADVAKARNVFPAEFWRELGIPVDSQPSSRFPPLWTGEYREGDIAIPIEIRLENSDTLLFLADIRSDNAENIWRLPLNHTATQEKMRSIAVGLKTWAAKIAAARAERRSEILARLQSRIHSMTNVPDNFFTVAAAQTWIDNVLDDDLSDDPTAMAELQPDIDLILANADQREQESAAALARRLAIAERAIAEANTCLAEYDAYRNAARAWAEAETRRLWQPWCAWEISFGAVAITEDGDRSIEFQTRLVNPESYDPSDPPDPPDVNGGLLDAIGLSGNVTHILIHTAAYSTLRVFDLPPDVSERLDYHRYYTQAGYTVNVPPCIADDPCYPEDLIAPVTWSIRRNRLLGDAIADLALWRLRDWSPGDIAASTPDALID